MRSTLVFACSLFCVACTCVDPQTLNAFDCTDGGCTIRNADAGSGGAGGGVSTGGGSGGGSASEFGGGSGGTGGGTSCQAGAPCTTNANTPCRAGVTSCASGVAECIDGASSANGVRCGDGLLCRNGVCATCVVGQACSANPDPCLEGEVSCGTQASCDNTTRTKPAGSACGVGKVCTTAGSCITCDEGGRCASNPGAPCVLGVVRCASGSPVCVDGPPAASGLACGADRVCVSGTCSTCVAGDVCTSNPSAPCKRGVSVCGAQPRCDDGANSVAGSVCGTDRVCSPTGTCVACAAGAPCTTNPDALCHRGVIQCSSGAPVCVDDTLKPAGTSCGTDQVCSASGACVACAAGQACATNPTAACRQGTTTCTTGQPTCVDGSPKDAGTACGPTDVCDANGFCGRCVDGMACSSNAGAPCKTGVITCASGSAQCVDASNVSAGTSCGPDRVCNGQGGCSACVAGVACTTNPSLCKVGLTSCATGTQTCVDSGNRVAGTSCGTNQVCSVNGNCVACVANAACTGNPSPACKNGLTSCSTGAQTCVDGSNKAAGTTCGASQVCDGSGNCGACVANSPCTTNPGAPCVTGKTDCSTGSTRCVDNMNVAAGTACGTGQVCNGTGACIACAAGGSCSTNPNLCKSGVNDCSTGALRCIDGANKMPGSSCGTNQVCDASATCTNCVPNAACMPANSCLNGGISCTTGTPVCATTSRKGTGASCGTGLVCNAQDQCVACVQGAACTTNPGSACRNGTTECSSGAPVCVDASPKTTGTACPGGVCNAGNCVACNEGGACTTNTNAQCKVGVVSCASGAAVCNDGGNKMNGTTCPGGVCNAGACVACNAGASCTTNPDTCRLGTISCTTGAAVCVDGAPKANGTTCPGGVCSAGACSACSAGSACTSNPSAACRNGVIDCATGTARCVDSANKMNGTTCTGGVCLNGACNPCAGGTGCSTNPNAECQNGSVDCSSGNATCVNGSNKMNGTSCTGGACLNGACNACSTGASCVPPNVCKTGTIACGTGSPVCNESGNVSDGTACPGGNCLSGNCVACTPGGACNTNPNTCKTGIISCATGSPVCIDNTNKPDITTACGGGVCIAGACCTGCFLSGVCYPGNAKLKCGLGGVECSACMGLGNVCTEGFCEGSCMTCFQAPPPR